jgi:dihydroxyacetone kinase-like predicted kinase
MRTGTMPSEFDATSLERIVGELARRLHDYRADLNRLNVFPVADKDTGDNLAALLESVTDQVSMSDDVVEGIARGALLGARGSSAVIFGQALRAFVTELRDLGTADRLAAALSAAADAARSAVADPVEGTMLTVADDAARAARDVTARSSVETVVRAAAEAGRLSLMRTTDLLPPLASAGVVDAGGVGYVLFLDALRDVVVGEIGSPLELPAGSGPMAHHNGGGRYEVVCLVSSGRSQVDELRDQWRSLGDTVAIGGGGSTWRCHVHTDDVAGALAAARTVGDVSDVEITDLSRQMDGP